MISRLMIVMSSCREFSYLSQSAQRWVCRGTEVTAALIYGRWGYKVPALYLQVSRETGGGHGVQLWRFHVDRGLSWVLTCTARDVAKCYARPRTKFVAISRQRGLARPDPHPSVTVLHLPDPAFRRRGEAEF